MAKFVISIENGKFETPLEGENGEEVTPEMASAYAQMQMGWALGHIAEQLGDISENLESIRREMELKRVED